MITNLKWGSRGKNFVITAQSQFVTKKSSIPFHIYLKFGRGKFQTHLQRQMSGFLSHLLINKSLSMI
jgi:hypothetical protein